MVFQCFKSDDEVLSSQYFCTEYAKSRATAEGLKVFEFLKMDKNG